MSANTTGRQVSDRVEITRGSWTGYTGTVIERTDSAVRVRLNETGGYRWFDRRNIRWQLEA